MKTWVRITGTQFHAVYDLHHTECGRSYQSTNETKEQIDVPFSKRCHNCLRILTAKITVKA